MRIYTLIILMSPLLVGCRSSNLFNTFSSASPPHYEKTEIQMANIRAHIMAHSMEVREATNDQDLAFAARNYIYREVILKPSAPGVDFFNFWENYLLSVEDDEYGHICDGLAITYASVLKALDIPVRHLKLFSKKHAPFDSHATDEIYINGTWIASDPTFNISYVDESGNFLSYEDLMKRRDQGLPILWSSNGYPIVDARRPDRYYISLEKLMKYVIVYPAVVRKNGEVQQFDTTYYPVGFDGVLTTPNGELALPGPYSIWSILSL